MLSLTSVGIGRCDSSGGDQQTPPPATGMMAYYPFTGNANDESPNGNHGIVSGVTLVDDRHGRAHSAYSFDGIDDFIQVPHDPAIDFGDELDAYSVSLWLKAVAPSPARVLQKWNEERVAAYPFSLQANTTSIKGVIKEYVSDSVRTNLVSASGLWDGVWHHLVFVVDRTAGFLFLYIDAQLEDTQLGTLTGSLSNSSDLYMGVGTGVPRYFGGSLDDLRIYNRTLSGPEITALFREGL